MLVLLCSTINDFFRCWRSNARTLNAFPGDCQVMATKNILILGQTGTGKSTLINSIANYARYPSFDAALAANDPVCLLPTRFSRMDDDFNEVIVALGGSDTNERTQAGASCTQEPRVYSLRTPSETLNFIDVPGIGDTDGVERDQENVRKIHDAIAHFDVLHAVFVVLRSDSGKATTEYMYCLTEILLHLHRDAIANVCFIVTSTRGSNYSMGHSREPLNMYLRDMKQRTGIELSIEKNTVYCMDNDGFLFQCACYCHPQTLSESQNGPRESWETSRRVVTNLLAEVRRKPPHPVSKTLAVVRARTSFILLAKPLAELAECAQHRSWPHPPPRLRNPAFVDLRLIAGMPDAVSRLQTERNVVLDCLMGFIRFLKVYAVWEYNQYVVPRLTYDLRSLEATGSSAAELDKAKRLSDYWGKVKASFEVATSANHTPMLVDTDFDIIWGRLFRLPIHGRAFKKLHDTELAIEAAGKFSEDHFVVFRSDRGL